MEKEIKGKKQESPCERCGVLQAAWSFNTCVLYDEWDEELGVCIPCSREIQKKLYDVSL